MFVKNPECFYIIPYSCMMRWSISMNSDLVHVCTRIDQNPHHLIFVFRAALNHTVEYGISVIDFDRDVCPM